MTTWQQREFKNITETIFEKVELMDKNGNPYYIIKFEAGRPLENIFAFSRKGKIGDKWYNQQNLEWCMDLDEGKTYEFTYFVSDKGTAILSEWTKEVGVLV